MSVEIWKGPDFRALSRDAQGMYTFLISQADILHIGLIGLRMKRWATAAAGLTISDVERDLKELEAARFVIIDWDAEELLVRTFLRGDKVYRQPQVLSVAAEQVCLVTSLALRVALRVELERIAELEMPANSRPLIAKMIEELADVAALGATDAFAGGEGGRHPTSHPGQEGGGQALGVRGVSTAVTTDSPSPNPLDPDPQPSLGHDALPIDVPAPQKPPKGPSTREIEAAFARFWEIYPRRVSRGDALKAFTKAAKAGIDLEVVISGAARYRDDGARQRSEIKYTKHAATWLNGQCWLDEAGPPARASPNGHRPFRNPEDPSIYEGDL